mmetsp:Transcript_7872/g.15225  ORF Transcript_7872/g.15225 Transcript_7872/m.15225 type:complete len:1014 (-) Transcript_7872:50-3091(-)
MDEPADEAKPMRRSLGGSSADEIGDDPVNQSHMSRRSRPTPLNIQGSRSRMSLDSDAEQAEEESKHEGRKGSMSGQYTVVVKEETIVALEEDAPKLDESSVSVEQQRKVNFAARDSEGEDKYEDVEETKFVRMGTRTFSTKQEPTSAFIEESRAFPTSATLPSYLDRTPTEELDDIGLLSSRTKAIEEIEEEIVRYCQERHCLFEDDDFPARPSSLYTDTNAIPEYDQELGCERWLRPQEFSENPVLYANGVSPGDVEQGSLGDCWFLGALCTLATKPELLDRLFVNTEHMLTCGFVTCQFFKNGEWKQVIVDTRLPYNGSFGAPIYAHCNDPNEMWLPLLEKAYAKLHHNYQALHGGSMIEALVDLSAETSEKYNLRDTETTRLIETGEFWDLMLKYFRMGCLMGCSNSSKETEADDGEAAGIDGILNNHAYGVLEVRDIENLQLIRIRNPWGKGEWKGTFADEEEEWDRHPGLKEKLNYQFGNDGTWWMTFSDWVTHYNKLYVCRIFPERWQKYSIDGRWEGKTAGGAPPVHLEKEEDSNEHLLFDSDDKWFNNPQFRVSVTRRTQLFVSLMQADEKLTKKPYFPVNFLILKTKDKKNRIWEKDRTDVILEAATGLQRLAQREITKEIFLEPAEGRKVGHFVIIPNLEIEGRKLEAEAAKGKKVNRPFWLRIFSQNPIDVVELSETLESTVSGEWTEQTGGGRRALKTGKDNPLWCKNPQYFLNIRTPTILKILLKKYGKTKRARESNCGLVICRAQLRQAQRKTLTQTVGRKTQAAASKLEILTLDMLERKLQILPLEWWKESYYNFEDTSCLFLRLEPSMGPYLVTPTLTADKVAAQFTLSVFSNQPVSLERLEDSKNLALSGAWTKETAGGSHLHERPYEENVKGQTWKDNPKFLLKFNNQGPIKAKITISRAESHWSWKIARDHVGCMMGLYIFPGSTTKVDYSLRLNGGSVFLPMNELTEIFEQPENIIDGYLLMPTTYEPKVTGPFVISVSSDFDFSLTPLQEAS